MAAKSSIAAATDIQKPVTKTKTHRLHSQTQKQAHTTRPDQLLIDPVMRPSAPSVNSFSSTPRLTPRAAPPSTPLPPIPVPGPSPTQDKDALPNGQRQVNPSPAMSASTGEKLADGKAEMDAGAGQGANIDSNAASPIVSRPRPLAVSQPTHGVHQYKKEVTQIHVPKSRSTQQHPPTSFPGGPSQAQAQQAKSGLLKRLTTRLSGTRSSPSLRPQENSPVPPSSNLSPSPAPAPSSAPTRQNQNQGQSLTNRLSLAALASHRADKREARAREDQRATDARRAAALAERGLLPASRRYSVAALPTDEEDGQNPKEFDPFKSDGLGMGRERESVEGVVVDVNDRVNDGNESGGKVSEAEALIREWRERNALANSRNGSTGVRISELDAQPTHVEAPASATSAGDTISSPVEPITSPKAAPIIETTTSAPKSLARADPAPPISNPKPDGGLTPLPTPPTKKVATLKVDTREVPSATHAIEEKEKKGHAGDVSVKAKEKAALGAWKFPTTSPISEKSASELSTLTRDKVAHAKLAALDEDVAASPPPLPPKSKKDSLGRAYPPSSPTSGPLPTSPISSASSQKAKVLHTPSSPTQISFPASPTSHFTASAGKLAQASSLITPSTSTSSQSIPASRTRIQAQKQHSAPSSNASLMPSLPALSPTTSTTSTSGGSALPRTPSTSSNGHSPVRVLDAPREVDEDALLIEHDESTTTTPTPGNTGFKRTGSKDAKLFAKSDSEADELGALPPLPASSPPSRGSSAIKISDVEKERSGESDKRKRASLFGRRRTTQTGPPMIVIPEGLAGHAVVGKIGGSGQEAVSTAAKPWQTSSLTNLRRTVTSVTSGLTNATSAGARASFKTPLTSASASLDSASIPQYKASFTGRDRVPQHAATMPTPKPLASPRSTTSGADSLSPTSYSLSSTDSRRPGIGLRVQALNPTMHSRGSILMEAHAIEDDESRRLSELAFLD